MTVAEMHSDRAHQATRTNPSRWQSAACTAEHLEICPTCGGSFVYPLDWREEGPSHWCVTLRCPDCERVDTGVFGQAAVERLDNELDRATEEILSDLKRITHANMSDEVAFFVRALNADVIVPSDF